jgi:hypothetical protein
MPCSLPQITSKKGYRQVELMVPTPLVMPLVAFTMVLTLLLYVWADLNFTVRFSFLQVDFVTQLISALLVPEHFPLQRMVIIVASFPSKPSSNQFPLISYQQPRLWSLVKHRQGKLMPFPNHPHLVC